MTNPQPERALDAAHRLVTEGRHVHYVAEGQARCLSGHCAQPTA